MLLDRFLHGSSFYFTAQISHFTPQTLQKFTKHFTFYIVDGASNATFCNNSKMAYGSIGKVVPFVGTQSVKAVFKEVWQEYVEMSLVVLNFFYEYKFNVLHIDF